MGNGREVRPATLDDVPAFRLILAANGEDAPVAPGGEDVAGPYLAHLVRAHRAMLALQDGVAVGFGTVVDTGRALHLADLFVVPEHAGRGIGRALLGALFDDAPHRTTFASADPRALPLYVRAGMDPLWPNLYLEGSAPMLPDTPPGLAARAGSAAEAAGLELAWTGAARAVDHEFWTSESSSVDLFAIEDGEGPVAFGYGRGRQEPGIRLLHRMLVRPGADPVAPLLAGLARAARGGRIDACVPGPNPALRVLLEAGFRIVDRDQFQATDPALVDPARLVPNPGML